MASFACLASSSRLPAATEVSWSHLSIHEVCPASFAWQWWPGSRGQQEENPSGQALFKPLFASILPIILLAEVSPKASPESKWEGSTEGHWEREGNNLGPFFAIDYSQYFKVEISQPYRQSLDCNNGQAPLQSAAVLALDRIYTSYPAPLPAVLPAQPPQTFTPAASSHSAGKILWIHSRK